MRPGTQMGCGSSIFEMRSPLFDEGRKPFAVSLGDPLCWFIMVYLTPSTASNSISQDISTIGSQSLPVGVATPWGKVAARGTSAAVGHLMSRKPLVKWGVPRVSDPRCQQHRVGARD